MSLKAQSWLGTGLLTVGLLALVFSFIIRPGSEQAQRDRLTAEQVERLKSKSSAVAWVSAVLIVAGVAGLVLAVRNASRQIAGQSARIESMLADAARAAAERKGEPPRRG